MPKSNDVPSSSSKTSTAIEDIFSHKRFFCNNLDSYHGGHILKELSRILEKNAESTTKEPSTHSLVGEEVDIPTHVPPVQPYEIIGTVSDPKIKSLDNVSRIVPKVECIPQMLTCGTVIMDVSYDIEQLKLAMEFMKILKGVLNRQGPPKSADSGDATTGLDIQRRRLILISSVMTWAMTKPLDPDNPEMAFIETDFRKRKPHPNYKQHYDCENEVVGIARNYKHHIGALVVASGMTYGGKEDCLYFWFQKAWECEKLLPIFGRGGNIVPIINVLDLAQIVYNLVEDFPKKLYILAVEQNITKQREIIKAIGRTVGTGMFKCIPIADAFLIPEIDQRTFDLMTLNLSMEPTFIVETMGLQWTSEATFAENVPVLIKQYVENRGLKPFKIVLYGPPVVGKTTLAKQICEAYGLMYLSMETVVEDVIQDLTWRIRHYEEGEVSALPIPTGEEEVVEPADDEDQGDEEGAIEAAKTTLAMLLSGVTPTEDEILGYIRQRLLSHEAMNKGWVLDGIPANLAHCTALFEKGEEQDIDVDEENDEDKFEEDLDLYNNVLKKILPELVVSLAATDDFICEKAMRQPENDARLTEEVLLRRLNEFRLGDTRDLTPLNFFDELDIHPFVVEVTDHSDYAMKIPYSEITLRMGRPCRYAKLLAKIEASEKLERIKLKEKRLNEAKELEELQKKMQEEREEKMEYWSELYSLMREDEEAALAAAGEPMRNYLIKYIFPTLTPALLEVAKLRPDDPVDFLAEYLFKLNPTGKMLEPGYNLQAEKILGKIKILDDALKDLDIQIDPLVPPEANLASPEVYPNKHNINPMSNF